MQTILAVDDQQGIRRLLEEVFKVSPYQVITAGDGIQALERCQEKPPDLVLLDMKMPGLDGLEVLRIVTTRYPQVPVVMMTAYGELQIVEEAINLGAKGYITKPFDIMELRHLVDKLLAAQ